MSVLTLDIAIGYKMDMPINIGKLFRDAREAKGWTQLQLAEKSGINQGYISEIEKGKKFPGEKSLPSLMEALEVTLLPLRLKAEPLKIEPRLYLSTKFAEAAVQSEEESRYIGIPIVAPVVAAGSPRVVYREDIVDIAFIHRRTLKKRNPADLLCTYVKGDSMEPVLRDGAIVCIDTKSRPEDRKAPPGSIWAIRKDEGTVVKYLQIRDNMLVLVSENKIYQVEIVTNPEAIVGRIIWAWQSLI